ncbi:MAG: DNA repair protein RadC [Pseudomonadota bacterium]
MAIRDWPADERPREKLLERGAESLTDAELLAIFLRTGVAGKTAVDLARGLLDEFGSLPLLLGASRTRFCSAKGLGSAKFAQLQAVLEMGRRYLHKSMQENDVLVSSDLTRQYLASRLRGVPHEVFACIFLDNRNRVIRYQELFQGTLNAANVYPREVVKAALSNNAAAVIFSHNHPSGVAEPSIEDKRITERLKQALALVDIAVLDHIIIGDGCEMSFADRGLI